MKNITSVAWLWIAQNKKCLLRPKHSLELANTLVYQNFDLFVKVQSTIHVESEICIDDDDNNENKQ